MNQNIKKRLRRTAILALIAFIIGGGAAYYQVSSKNAYVIKKESREIENPSAKVAGLSIGGPFALVDHNGNDVTEKDFDGKYKLIYFGFTYCPAICPTELQKMIRVMEKIGSDADKVQLLFITVDPERDTPEVMGEYVALFQNGNLTGLTGTTEQIDVLKKNYRIFATKVQNDDLNDYTVDHSSFTYLMSPDNELISIYRIKDSVEFMAKDIQNRL